MKKSLAICELIHPRFHGTDIDNSGHYIVTWFISLEQFYSLQYLGIFELLKRKWWERKTSPSHPFIRAFWKIIARPKYFTLQIVEDKELNSGEYVAIMNTLWLRIFQRKWRNICKERKLAQKKIKQLRYRSIHGKWPST